MQQECPSYYFFLKPKCSKLAHSLCWITFQSIEDAVKHCEDPPKGAKCWHPFGGERTSASNRSVLSLPSLSEEQLQLTTIEVIKTIVVSQSQAYQTLHGYFRWRNSKLRHSSQPWLRLLRSILGQRGETADVTAFLSTLPSTKGETSLLLEIWEIASFCCATHTSNSSSQGWSGACKVNRCYSFSPAAEIPGECQGRGYASEVLKQLNLIGTYCLFN